jgi:hypothetical protein
MAMAGRVRLTSRTRDQASGLERGKGSLVQRRRAAVCATPRLSITIRTATLAAWAARRTSKRAQSSAAAAVWSLPGTLPPKVLPAKEAPQAATRVAALAPSEPPSVAIKMSPSGSGVAAWRACTRRGKGAWRRLAGGHGGWGTSGKPSACIGPGGGMGLEWPRSGQTHARCRREGFCSPHSQWTGWRRRRASTTPQKPAPSATRWRWLALGWSRKHWACMEASG